MQSVENIAQVKYDLGLIKAPIKHIDKTKTEILFLFFVSKTLFMGKSKEDFTQQQINIINSITNKVTREYDILNEKYKPITNGFKLTFSRELLTTDDAVKVAEVIDKIIFLYVVENKK